MRLGHKPGTVDGLVRTLARALHEYVWAYPLTSEERADAIQQLLADTEPHRG
jgi:hypothetical protein